MKFFNWFQPAPAPTPEVTRQERQAILADFHARQQVLAEAKKASRKTGSSAPTPAPTAPTVNEGLRDETIDVLRQLGHSKADAKVLVEAAMLACPHMDEVQDLLREAYKIKAAR